MTKAGKLYKAGIVMANSRVILEAHRRWGEMVDKDKQQAEKKKKDKEQQWISDGIEAFRRWVEQGRQITSDAGNNYPILSKKDAVAIVKVLLPRIDIEGVLKMKEFASAKACIKWLGKIGRGTTWDEEMGALEREMEGAQVQSGDAI